MSTIKATTLSNLAGDKTIGTDRVAQGTAAAWVNFNGTGTVAIRSSYNVSSITDNGVGNYTANFTSAMPDNGYAYLITHNGVNSGGQATETLTVNKLVTSIRLTTQAAGIGVTDQDQVNITIFR